MPYSYFKAFQDTHDRGYSVTIDGMSFEKLILYYDFQ